MSLANINDIIIIICSLFRTFSQLVYIKKVNICKSQKAVCVVVCMEKKIREIEINRVEIYHNVDIFFAIKKI